MVKLWRFYVGIHYFPRMSRLNQQGKAPLMFYVKTSTGGKSLPRATGLSVDPDLWRKGKKGQVPVPREERRYLDNLEDRANEISRELQQKGVAQPTGRQIMAALIAEVGEPVRLLEFADEFIEFQAQHGRTRRRIPGEPLRRTQTRSTGRANSTRQSVLRGYVKKYPHQNVTLAEVNNGWLERYERYLRHEHVITTGGRKGEVGLISTSVAKQIQFVRLVMNHAVRMDHLAHNPTKAYRVNTNDIDRNLDHLTEGELASIRAYQFAAKPLRDAANLFLLYCEWGINFVDFQRLTNANVIATDTLPAAVQDGLLAKNITTWLVGYRQKTGIRFVVPMSPLSQAIVAQYGSIERLPRMENSTLGRFVTEVFALVGINKKGGTLLARKTFAYRWRNAPGVAKKTTSLMMGHVTEHMLDYYADTHLEGVAADLASSSYRPFQPLQAQKSA